MNTKEKIANYIYGMDLVSYIENQLNDSDNLSTGPYSDYIEFDGVGHSTIFTINEKDVELGDFDAAFLYLCDNENVKNSDKNLNLFNKMYYATFKWLIENFDLNKKIYISKSKICELEKDFK